MLNDLFRYLWRLIPANPMVVRVVAAGGKRVRHMWFRFFYLAALFVVMLLWGNLFMDTGASYAEAAKNATRAFMVVSLMQLALMSFIAPIFTAGAITQERDSQTFDILLTTPLSNGQIVFGTLLSRLFFVWALLLSGLPIFCITMIYGGVTTTEVFQSFGLAACTGLVTGATAIMIAMLKIGTRRTIFAFFLGIALYLLAVFALGWSSSTAIAEADVSEAFGRRMSWLAAFHPFLALFVVTGQTPAPVIEDVQRYGWPWTSLAAYPQFAYMALTTLASLLMIAVSLAFVRSGSKEGETTWLTRITGVFKPATTANGERRHPPRRVWSNPIAWREAVTRGSAGSRAFMRWAFIGGGLLLGLVLLIIFEQNPSVFTGGGGSAIPAIRGWLTVIVWIEMAIILLVVTNTAAGTLTREKESQTVEILLTTPLTSKYILGGMLQGLVRFVVPLIAVPTGTLLIFVVADVFRASGKTVLYPEVVLFVPLLMLAFCALAALVGLQFSLTSKKTVQAVMISTSIVLGASGLLWGCGFAMTGNADAPVSAAILPFTPFPAIEALINVDRLFESGVTPRPGKVLEVRMIRAITSLISAAIYFGVTYSLYKNMIRGFDMIVRRQTA